MNKKIVNESCTLKLKTNTGSVSIVPVGSVKGLFKISGGSCYNAIAFTVTGATNGTVQAATGAGVIQGNSDKVKSGALPVVLDNAESQEIVLTGTIPGSPPVSGTFTDTVVIQTPGQTKAGGL